MTAGRKRLQRLAGTKVRILPLPWVFNGVRIRILSASGNRWKIQLASRRLSLSRSSGPRIELPVSQVMGVIGPSTLLLRCQVLITGAEVSLEPLPSGYWSEQGQRSDR